MTEANQKIMYEDFIARGMKKHAADILKVYPQFAEKPPEDIPEPEEPELPLPHKKKKKGVK